VSFECPHCKTLFSLKEIRKEKPNPDDFQADMVGQFPEDLQDKLTFEEKDSDLVITPIQYLGNRDFARAASVVRSLGGEYVSAGKDSHFIIPRQGVYKQG